ncbi:integrase arm-type DNA-binding domain-containing protein [Methylobacter sp.]|uniref:tyrosine-type recombinase/integrase n=1 Tax=Methylobacter sp. TaxID=2051955 RepID=UPI0024888822|nr:integrase arm-type DNA-binding domain-containing protein [Methylobacter sp.]MDI1278812.1 integrase arm-type DNA-binding domain-containing protein [Methylobacter sp.]MDI1358523.1 integrase arm-type DNA-binding domain-containing protein [Methylobacter sp.]
MPLSDTAIKNAKPADKPYKMQDEKGMYLLVHPNGGKYFRYNYRFDGKRLTLSIGVYPATSLKEAREKRDTAIKQIAGGINPSENKKAVKQSRTESAANSFEVIAREWGQKKVNEWDDKNNRSKRMLERNIFPWLGNKPIIDILPKDILACLRRVEDRGTIETAHRSLQICGQVFRYAVATGRTERDITPDLRGALPPAKGEHFASITEPKQVAELLRAIDGYQGSLASICALKLAPLVFVRPGELRAAEWQHFDLEAKEWRYYVSKTDVQHIVPLSTQAIAILEELQPLTGHGRFVFSSERTPRGDRCMSENTLNAALKRLGYGKDVMTAHGFRAMARTILDEVLGVRVDFIEHQLAHAVRDPNGRAYNRTAHLPERHKMMQGWADYLDGLKAGALVIQFEKRA